MEVLEGYRQGESEGKVVFSCNLDSLECGGYN